nr:MAG TPA: hypothetical protein [Caudoviricetes sp.]DAR42569.1 MAG TPA: hypothetical protein [Caudoviricetes sp.]
MTTFCTGYLERGALESPIIFGLFCFNIAVISVLLLSDSQLEVSVIGERKDGAETVNN